MNDAFVALKDYSQKYTALCSLWFVDENYAVHQNPGLIDCTNAVTNRVDIANYLKTYCDINLSDFNCDQYIDKSFDVIYLRVPKSKALLNHLIFKSMDLLKPNGRLVCVGYNDEGIKNTFKKIEKAFGELIEQTLLGKGLRIAEFSLINPQLNQIEDRNYNSINLIDNDFGIEIFNKAGIYSAEKIDQGSVLLCETILEYCQEKQFDKILDIGCGNGFISLYLWKIFDKSQFVATDNNITAIDICKLNFEKNSVKGQVILDDCGKTLESKQFDLIVSNPPFHQGFNTSEYLTILFLKETERLLAANGEAWFVMNRFLKVESLVKEFNLSMSLISENQKYKILKFTR